MNASIKDVREAIAAQLSTLKGFQVSAYVLANPTPPHLWVRLGGEGIEFHRAMKQGLTSWDFVVQAFVGSAGGDIGAQQLLDDLLGGSRDLQALLESDRTLGGVCQDLIVTTCTGYREYATVAGTTLIGADWNLTVYT